MDSLQAVNKPRYADLIYVVEDDPDVSRLIEHNLRIAGYEVSTFFSGAPVVPSAAMARPSLFLLDIMLPGMNGFDLCRQIRQHERLGKTPVIFLSAKTQEPDRLQAFDVGGDGYITKPFSPRELVLRVKNLLKRRAAPLEPAQQIRFAGLVIDRSRHSVTYNNKPLDLTLTEFKLVTVLAERKGRVQSREQLLKDVWGYNTFIDTRTVDTHMRRLRDKLGEAAKLLDTVRGVGYRFLER